MRRSGQAGVVVIHSRPGSQAAFPPVKTVYEWSLPLLMVPKIRKKNNISWHMKIIWSSNLVSTDEAIVENNHGQALTCRYAALHCNSSAE